MGTTADHPVPDLPSEPAWLSGCRRGGWGTTTTSALPRDEVLDLISLQEAAAAQRAEQIGTREGRGSRLLADRRRARGGKDRQHEPESQAHVFTRHSRRASMSPREPKAIM